MAATSPPEAFPLERSPGPAVPTTSPGAPQPLARTGHAAMVTGAVALAAAALIEMSEGLLLGAGPWHLPMLTRLSAPLLTCGQVLLVGGALAARLAWRRRIRDARDAQEAGKRGSAVD